ncbi:hypothetical protein LRS74_23750 [Streptomyces sp. LX-29]|uniref:hypothetical protein n=1 Tax=Streptomyces sp. LX-29 TaxID=2900152 RepID=UPI00240D2D4D|nr:hypothetical protein [Streptomyces sp. LX-29]WFB09725.1 hypothetical protein LRS74_23750 [Streptomyces sp. LX-29]
MLKKALACASLAVAATGATGFIAPAAIASDAEGGNYSQNINLLPHLCVDAKDINVLNVTPIEVLNGTDGQQCNEESKVFDNSKDPLSDLLDLGAYQN